jgi:hypothetical protein
MRDGGFEFRLEQCTYHGELWYSAKIWLGDYGLMAYGRTPSRALGFAMRSLAEAGLQGKFEIEPWDSPVKGEVMEFVSGT